MERDISPPSLKRRRVSDDAKYVAVKALKGEKEPAEGRQGEASDSSVRIYSWNINGISPFLQKSITSFFSPSKSRPNPRGAPSPSRSNTEGDHASLRAFLRRHHWPHILCLQEVKIAFTDTAIQNAVKRAVNDSQVGPKYDAFFTLPTDNFNARGWGGKVYGVCTIIRRDFYNTYVERVRDVEWDKEGRVSIVELASKVEIWNVYAVNGTDNQWRDPRSGVVIGTRHNKKLLVHKYLMEDAKKAEACGKSVVIIGDMNVAPARIDGFPNLRTFPDQHVLNRKDFNEKFFKDPDGLQAVDVWRALKDDEKRYTYFPRGRPWGSSCDRVDLIIASKRLVDAGDVVDTEIFDSEEERGPSDHVPLAVELRLSG